MKKIVKTVLLSFILAPILFFILAILFFFGLNYIINSLSPKEDPTTRIFNAQIGDIYSDNNVTMEPIQIKGLKFCINTIKVDGPKLILKVKFEDNNIESAHFSYFLYNLNNSDDAMLAYSLIDAGLTYPLENFRKENTLSKNLPINLSQNIDNFSSFSLESNTDLESVFIASSTSKNGNFDMNLLKDGLTFELFSLKCTDASLEHYSDNNIYKINFEI